MKTSFPQRIFGAAAIASLVAGCSSDGSTIEPTIGVVQQSGARQASRISPDIGKAPLLYVAQFYENEILIYKQVGTNQTPVGTITNGLNFPDGLVVDSNGDLYVANKNASNILVFHRGATTAYKTLDDGGQYPNDVAVDSDGTVLVVNAAGVGAGSVAVYAPGSLTVTSTLTVPPSDDVYSDTIDRNHNLYVSYAESTTHTIKIVKYFRHRGAAHSTGIALTHPSVGGMAFDVTHDLVVADSGAPSINIYELPSPSPVRLAAIGAPGDLSIVNGGKKYWVVDYLANEVYKYTYPGNTLVDTISSGLSSPSGIAVDPAQQP